MCYAVEGWVHHDLRRTLATRLGDLDVPPHVTESLLNHVSGSKGGVAGGITAGRTSRRSASHSSGGLGASSRKSPTASRARQTRLSAFAASRAGSRPEAREGGHSQGACDVGVQAVKRGLFAARPPKPVTVRLGLKLSVTGRASAMRIGWLASSLLKPGPATSRPTRRGAKSRARNCPAFRQTSPPTSTGRDEPRLPQRRGGPEIHDRDVTYTLLSRKSVISSSSNRRATHPRLGPRAPASSGRAEGARCEAEREGHRASLGEIHHSIRQTVPANSTESVGSPNPITRAPPCGAAASCAPPPGNRPCKKIHRRRRPPVRGRPLGSSS